jgi:DNA helicase-2/ATP-dependent DNA helicase PcrA
MQFSNYQQAIFDTVAENFSSRTRQNLAIVARAGSGKTFTAVEIVKLQKRSADILYLPFNKAIAEEGKAKLVAYPNTDVRTLHSYGFKLVRDNAKKITPHNIQLDFDKNKYIVRDHIGEDTYQAVGQFIQSKFDKAFGLLKSLLWVMLDDPNETIKDENGVVTQMSLKELCDEHDLWLDRINAERFDFLKLLAEMWPKATDVYTREKERGEGRIAMMDFSDMIYLPYKYNLPCSKYDLVLIDEAQDLDPSQWDMVYRLAKYSNVIIIGDPMQTIYEFRGASADSMERAIAKLACKVLALPICYRCGTSIITEAKKIVPDLESPEGMHEGEVVEVPADAFYRAVAPSDAVIARTNAELVEVAFHLLFDLRKSCYIVGGEVRKTMFGIKKQANIGDGDDTETARVKLKAWEDAKLKQLQRKQLTPMYQSAFSALATLFHLFDTVGEGVAFLDRVFVDKPVYNAIGLSTVHRFKGREADTVYFLNPKLNPDEESERRLTYVGLTRAKHRLCLVITKF